jgi:hypothetical protein
MFAAIEPGLFGLVKKRGFLMASFKLAGAAAGLAALVIAGAGPAEAGGYHHRRGGWNPGAAAAVGIIGGLAAGAAIASARPAYGYGHGYHDGHGHHGYAPRRAYYHAPEPAYGECYVVQKKVWIPGWGWEMRRKKICD